MGENTSRPRRPASGNRNKGCRRLDGLCNLTEEEKATRDKAAQRYRNLAAMHRVYEAAVLAKTGTPSAVIRQLYWDPVTFASRFPVRNRVQKAMTLAEEHSHLEVG